LLFSRYKTSPHVFDNPSNLCTIMQIQKKIYSHNLSKKQENLFLGFFLEKTDL